MSGDYDSVLALQGVNLLIRMVIARTTLTVAMKQWEEDGVTHLEFQNAIASSLPGSTENFTLNWEPTEFYDHYFGNVRDRARWVKVDDLEEDFLRNGWEEGTAEVIHLFTDHLDVDVTTSQVCGFEFIDGLRRHTRRMVVKRADVTTNLRVVFDHVEFGQGNIEEETSKE